MPEARTSPTWLAFAAVTLLFFGWGLVSALIDPLVPAVKSVFALSFLESQLTQFAWFIAYGLVSLPAAALLARAGSIRTILIALGVMVGGCLLVPVATSLDRYSGVLLALFVIASGVTILQVAANPLVARLGSPDRAAFRLTLSQAFNSLGTVLAPPIGAVIMLTGGVFAQATDRVSRAETLAKIDTSFAIIATIFVALAILVFLARTPIEARGGEASPGIGSPLEALSSRWAVFGAVAIFVYVGSEVMIGSFMINFLNQDGILGVSLTQAANLLALYWGGAMVGRFAGSIILTRLPASVALAGAAGIAALLCAIVIVTSGNIAGGAALSVGLFNSIMFPVIFALTLERSTASEAATSGLLCTAIVGGAILPLLAGLVADKVGLNAAFVVPLVGYSIITTFALAARRVPVLNGAAVTARAH